MLPAEAFTVVRKSFDARKVCLFNVKLKFTLQYICAFHSLLSTFRTNLKEGERQWRLNGKWERALPGVVGWLIWPLLWSHCSFRDLHNPKP